MYKFTPIKKRYQEKNDLLTNCFYRTNIYTTATLMARLTAETNGAVRNHPINEEGVRTHSSWLTKLVGEIAQKALKFPELGPLASAHIEFKPTFNIRGVEIHLHYGPQAEASHHLPEEKTRVNPEYAAWFIKFIDWIGPKKRRNDKVVNLDDYREIENPETRIVIPRTSSLGLMDLARVTQSKS